MTRKNY